jgi:hypothetical protein
MSGKLADIDMSARHVADMLPTCCRHSQLRRVLLEEYASEIVYIKGIHNTVADAISQLDYDPKLNITNESTHAMLGVKPEELSQQWKSYAHHWRSYIESTAPMQAYCFHMNEVFANCSEEDEIYL